jgi:hypothetical protein
MFEPRQITLAIPTTGDERVAVTDKGTPHTRTVTQKL